MSAKKTPEGKVQEIFSAFAGDARLIGNEAAQEQTAPIRTDTDQTEQVKNAPRKARAKNSERLEIRLSQELKTALQRAADTEQTDLAEILRKAAREYLTGKGYL